MKKNSIAILIPIYKDVLTQAEKASLHQVIKILGSYPILFVCSKNLATDIYKEYCIEFGIEVSEIKFIRFNPYYFSSISGYNKLLISYSFYKRFSSFKYVLIYQLDAWVFKDDLQYWCDKNYDYIGAPWFEGWVHANADSKFIGAGNGGFSLRKISAHLKVLTSFKYLRAPGLFVKEFKNNIGFASFKKMVISLTLRNNTFSLFNDWDNQEDVFWSFKAGTKFKWFKVAPPEIAMSFSFEVNASLLFKLNHNNLPFGCHKWEIYDSDFWKEIISIDKH